MLNGQASTISFGQTFSNVSSVQAWPLDNYFGAVGANGGDRIGVSELRFITVVPEPTTATSGTAGSAWTVSPNTPYLFSISARPPVYLPPCAPTISCRSGVAVLTARGTPGVEYGIDATTNLADWTADGTAFADAAGIIRFTDPVPRPRRFYRFQ